METISNVASNVVTTASKVIWGEQKPAATTQNETAGQEPVNGVQGKGTPEEPFDQGNAPIPNGAASTSSTEPISKSDSTPASTNNPSTSAMSESSKAAPTNLHNAATGGTPDPLANTEGTGVTGSSAQNYAPKGGDVIPSESSENPGAAPSSGAAPSQKQQGADRPQEAPSDTTSKDDPESLLKKRDPNDHSGEPMRMHGESDKLPETQAERRESKVGNPGGQAHGTDEPKGTGEKWVKTSGLAADGGDFDATKPGAGREADRESLWKRTGRSIGRTLSKADGVAGILEEKGVHKDAKGAMDNPTATGSPSPERKEKASKMGKIKEKLHIGHKHK